MYIEFYDDPNNLFLYESLQSNSHFSSSLVLSASHHNLVVARYAEDVILSSSSQHHHVDPRVRTSGRGSGPAPCDPVTMGGVHQVRHVALLGAEQEAVVVPWVAGI